MIIIDYSDKRPIYEQIIERFQTLILNGALEPETKLPSVRALAVDLSINPNTIQRAYSALERDGFIYSVKGRGNFVRANEDLAKRQQEKLQKELHKLLLTCRESGIPYASIISCVNQIYGEVQQ